MNQIGSCVQQRLNFELDSSNRMGSILCLFVNVFSHFGKLLSNFSRAFTKPMRLIPEPDANSIIWVW